MPPEVETVLHACRHHCALTRVLKAAVPALHAVLSEVGCWPACMVLVKMCVCVLYIARVFSAFGPHRMKMGLLWLREGWRRTMSRRCITHRVDA
jgi:hypothetical protein